MWHIIWTQTFTQRCRRVLRRHRELDQALAVALALLAEDPHHPRLKLHALRGELDGLWAIRVTYGVRLVLSLNLHDREVTLLALGSDDEAYR